MSVTCRTIIATLAVVAMAAPACGKGGGGEEDADADADELTGDASDADEEEAPEPPPEICKGAPSLGGGPYFEERADDVLLGPSGIHALGNRLMNADLDGDLYPDLIVHGGGSNNRDSPETDTYEERRRWIVMNRAGGSGRQFEDFTVESAYGAIRDGGMGRSCQLAVAGDVDNDGDLDLFSGTYVDASSGADPPDPGDRSEILLNDGSGHFTLAPLSHAFGEYQFTTAGATFVDSDRDGLLDVYVGNFYVVYGYFPSFADTLLRGGGDGTFTDVTEASGLMLPTSPFGEGANKPSYGVSSCDIDGDGDTDLLQSSYGRQLNMLWINDGGTFTEVGRETGYASDEQEDYTDNQMYRCHCQLSGDCTAPAPVISCTSDTWNVGYDDQPWRLGGNTFTTLCGDIDNDGDNDVLHTEIRHWWAGSSSDPSQLLRNVEADTALGFTFERVDNTESGLHRGWPPYNWNEGDISGAFLDFDNDGRKDILLMSSDYPPDTRTYFFHQQADGTFMEIAPAAGIDTPCGQEVTVADFDRDGDVDVITAYSTMRNSSWPGDPPYTEARLFYYVNTAGQDADSIEIHLVGDPGASTNASAIGARVEVTAGGITQMREVSGGYGTFGLQEDMVLHFGVGGACTVDEIKVTWPDAGGTEQVFTDVRANYLVELTQGRPWADYIQALE